MRMCEQKRASPRQQAPGQGQGGEKVVQFRDATDKQPYHHQTHLSARPNTSQHAPKVCYFTYLVCLACVGRVLLSL